MLKVQTALNSISVPAPGTSKIDESPTQVHPPVPDVKVSKDKSGRITVSFPYAPSLIEKVKTIEGYKWHPDKKYWSFPDSDGILNKILKVFGQDKVHIDHTLHVNLPFVIDKLRKAIQAHHYSIRTEQTYVNWVKRFIFFHDKRHPSEMGEKEINTFCHT